MNPPTARPAPPALCGDIVAASADVARPVPPPFDDADRAPGRTLHAPPPKLGGDRNDAFALPKRRVR